MTRDWKEQLHTFQKTQDQEQIRTLFEAGKFKAVVEKLSQPKTDEEREMVDRCFYSLMKEACAAHKTEEACYYAQKIVQSSHSSRTTRSLVQERLTLLRRDPPSMREFPWYLLRQAWWILLLSYPFLFWEDTEREGIEGLSMISSAC